MDKKKTVDPLLINSSEFLDLKNQSEIPDRIKDEEGFVYRRKGNKHVSRKGVITYYFACIKCSFLKTFNFTEKMFKTSKNAQKHTCLTKNESSIIKNEIKNVSILK